MPEQPVSRRSVIRGAVLVGIGVGAGGIELLTTGPAAAAVASPTIADCATWAARPPSSPLSVIPTKPDKILVHHTATGNSTDYSLAHAYALSRSIQNYHMDHNGWSDTGQHFTISRGGFVTEGRHNSLSTLRAGSGMVVGAHCPGQNDKAIGIENEGIYTSVAPPNALYNQLVAMCAYICSQYSIPASQIFGHRDFSSTSCPGDVLYSMLPQLRTDVAAALAAGSGWTTTIDNTSGGFSASANWGVSTFSSQRYGADYRYANPQPISDAANYSVTIPTTGNYRLDVWHAANSGYNDQTPHVVFASSGTQTVTVNQRAGGGAWKTIGTFPFAAGNRQVLAISRWTNGTGYVIADAIRLTRV